jgi:hypothetical protein
MGKKTVFNCYIDESGDEGLGSKSSPWFVLSAVIVRASDERELMNYENEAIQKVWIDNGHNPIKRIHWRERTHSQRMGIAKILAEKPYTQTLVGVWKEKLTRTKENGLRNRSMFYAYACKLILERISWYVDNNNGHANIIFSHWGSLQKQELQNYICGYMKTIDCQIRPVFDVSRIEVVPMNELVMLRFADNCASAFGNALNPDEYGQLNYVCASMLKNNLYKYKARKGKVWGYGVKIFPAEASQDEFLRYYNQAACWFE